MPDMLALEAMVHKEANVAWNHYKKRMKRYANKEGSVTKNDIGAIISGNIVELVRFFIFSTDGPSDQTYEALIKGIEAAWLDVATNGTTPPNKNTSIQ